MHIVGVGIASNKCWINNGPLNLDVLNILRSRLSFTRMALYMLNLYLIRHRKCHHQA